MCTFNRNVYMVYSALFMSVASVRQMMKAMNNNNNKQIQNKLSRSQRFKIIKDQVFAMDLPMSNNKI